MPRIKPKGKGRVSIQPDEKPIVLGDITIEGRIGNPNFTFGKGKEATTESAEEFPINLLPSRGVANVVKAMRSNELKRKRFRQAAKKVLHTNRPSV